MQTDLRGTILGKLALEVHCTSQLVCAVKNRSVMSAMRVMREHATRNYALYYKHTHTN